MDGGNTFQQARFLGTAIRRRGASPTIQVSDTIETGEQVEWYRFRIQGRASSALMKPMLTFGGDELVPRMEVFKAVKGRPSRLVARLDTINSQTQKALTEGIYFIKISGTPAPVGSGRYATFAGRIDLFS